MVTLSKYTYTFQYLHGKENLLADLFSRAQFQKENTLDLNNNLKLVHYQEVLPITINNSKHNQINILTDSQIVHDNAHSKKSSNNNFYNKAGQGDKNILSNGDVNQTFPKYLLQNIKSYSL